MPAGGRRFEATRHETERAAGDSDRCWRESVRHLIGIGLPYEHNGNVVFMITNERQHKIARKRAAGFARAIDQFDARSRELTDVDPRLLRAELEGLKSQLADLRAELDEYDQLKSADLPAISVASFDELASGLIKARIAAGLSQRALAERLNLKEQQIQRYEAEGYASASFRRLCEVAQALEVQVENEMLLRVVPV